MNEAVGIKKGVDVAHQSKLNDRSQFNVRWQSDVYVHIYTVNTCFEAEKHSEILLHV